MIDSVNPATGEVLEQVESTPTNHFPRILNEARKAQREWSLTSFEHRARILKRFGEKLLARKRVVADLIARENGKPLVEAYSTEIIPALDFIKYYTKKSESILRRRRVRIGIPLLKSKTAFVQYEPIGVLGIISPWNYPLMLPVGQIIPALMAGNAVIFKPSEYTPLVGKLIADFLWEVGIPKNLFALVQGGGDVGSALVSLGVDKLFFTGSTSTGRKVSEAAAKNLTPVSLELGSKDAMIVFNDADIDAATSGALWGAFMNAGQTCVSIERCFVHEKVLDSFVGLLQKKVKELSVGAGTENETDIGAIISKAQFETIKKQVNDATSRGARIVAGGEFADRGNSYFIPPIVLTDVPMDSILMKEETFGPVLPIVEFRTDSEAIDLANASKFGLSASIWTADSKHGLDIARRIQAGAVVVNDVISYYGLSDGVVGGVKESGSGRVHGREGILETVSPKYYEVEHLRSIKKLWWYKYNVHSLSFFEEATDLLFSRNLLRRFSSLFKLAPNFLRSKKI